jgi:hypothetical protein
VRLLAGSPQRTLCGCGIFGVHVICFVALRHLPVTKTYTVIHWRVFLGIGVTPLITSARSAVHLLPLFPDVSEVQRTFVSIKLPLFQLDHLLAHIHFTLPDCHIVLMVRQRIGLRYWSIFFLFHIIFFLLLLSPLCVRFLLEYLFIWCSHRFWT